MLGFSKKRFFVTLGISVLVWLVSVVVQGLTLFKVTFSILGSNCQLTGYPIAYCVQNDSVIPFWIVHVINVFIWFWLIHLFWGWFEKNKN